MLSLAALSQQCSSEPETGSSPSGSGGAGGSPSSTSTTGGGGVEPASTGGGGVSSSTGGGGSDNGGSGTGTGTGTGTGGGAGDSSGAGGAGAGGSSAGGGGAGGSTGGSGGVALPDTSCAPGSILCEGFESYAAGTMPNGIWMKSTSLGAGSLTVDTTRAFAGAKSIHVTGKLLGDKANIAASLQTTSDTAYVRFMLYTASYPATSGVHSRLMRIGTADSANPKPDSSYSFASYNGTAIEKVDSIYMRSVSTHLNDPALLNRWVCWEFGIDKTGGIGKVKVHIWSDSNELTLAAAGSSTHAATSTSWDPIPFQLLMLGLDGNQADDLKADYWIDEIVVAPQRVGCPKAP